MLALAAFALGAAFVFVALVVDAFFGVAFVGVFASVFLGLPAVLVPAAFVVLVAFYKELARLFTNIWANKRTLAAGFFSLVEAAADFAAASFLANFTVPDGPVWLLATIILDFERWEKNGLCC